MALPPMRLRLLPPDSPLGWTPFAWLVYLSFYIAYAVLRNDSAADWVIDGAALVTFLALYFRGFWVADTGLLRVVFLIVALGALTAPRNPGANCFFIYAAAFLAEIRPPARAVRWLMVIVAIVVVETWVLGLPAYFWIPAVAISLLIGGTNIHFGEMRRKDQALIKAHELAEQLARTAERERIARDMHDLLGHTLSVIVLKSELAAKLAERNSARAVVEIREVEEISRNALAEVRRAIHGFRGERFADQLAASRTALEAAGVAVDAEVEPVTLGADEERALALALREAATNIVRHARASRCVVRLTRDGDVIQLEIADNGVGGDLIEGAGLSGMKARCGEIGGTVAVDGGNGTRLTIRVPARHAAPAALVSS
jgi:two-component system sensor histidine kinase DesK